MSRKREARTKSRPGTVLICDGRKIPLNPFVQRFIEETAAGMVRALEGVPEELKSIELRIRRK